MVLNRLVWSCFHQGTKLEEHNVGISIKPNAGEKVLFFRLDCPEARSVLGIPPTEPICDAAVFYRLNDEVPLLIVAEFRGSNIERAQKQVQGSIAAIRRYVPRDFMPRIVGLIITSGSAPRSDKREQAKLAANGIDIRYKSNAKKPVDLRQCLSQWR